jgi:hypothetical protein
MDCSQQSSTILDTSYLFIVSENECTFFVPRALNEKLAAQNKILAVNATQACAIFPANLFLCAKNIAFIIIVKFIDHFVICNKKVISFKQYFQGRY